MTLQQNKFMYERVDPRVARDASLFEIKRIRNYASLFIILSAALVVMPSYFISQSSLSTFWYGYIGGVVIAIVCAISCLLVLSSFYDAWQVVAELGCIDPVITGNVKHFTLVHLFLVGMSGLAFATIVLIYEDHDRHQTTSVYIIMMLSFHFITLILVSISWYRVVKSQFHFQRL